MVILHNAANNLGLGRAAFEGAVEYAKIRHQGGRNIIEHQAIGKKIADMALKLELASTMIYKAAWVADHPEVVADRLIQFSTVIPKDQLMAGTDCGFSTFAGFGKIDEKICYEKLHALVEGTKLASKVI